MARLQWYLRLLLLLRRLLLLCRWCLLSVQRLRCIIGLRVSKDYSSRGWRTGWYTHSLLLALLH
jgi:hypothetical protein